MDTASKDAEHLEAASKFMDWVHEQQQLDEEQDKRIVKLSVKSRSRRVIKQALSQALDKSIDALLDSSGDTEMKLLTKLAVMLIQSKKKKAAAPAAQGGGRGDRRAGQASRSA
jgi:hypothetical protein